MIIHYSEEICKNNFYERNHVMQTAYKLFSSGNVLCPVCHGSMTLHGSYERNIIDTAGDLHKGWIAQGYCGVCKKYHSIIPSFIMPYKQYSAEVVEKAILEHEELGSINNSSCQADESTIYRWINQFKERGASAVGWLISMLYSIYDQHISVLELRKEGMLKRLDRLTQRLLPIKTGRIIGRTNIILTNHNHGFV